jgi:hypothetical protein
MNELTNSKWETYPLELFKTFGEPVAFFNQCEPREWTFLFRDDFHHVVKVTMCGYTAYEFVKEMLDEIVSVEVVVEYDMVCTSSLCNPVDEDGAF